MTVLSKVHTSRIDLWLIVAIVVAVITSIGAGVLVFLAGPPVAQWIALANLFAGVGLPLWILLGTSYTLTQEQLLIRCGPFHWKVPISEIREVTPTRSALSSPALSLDRLCIRYGAGRTILISPRDKTQFTVDLDELRQHHSPLNPPHAPA
jgi:Bacterial PH domain